MDQMRAQRQAFDAIVTAVSALGREVRVSGGRVLVDRSPVELRVDAKAGPGATTELLSVYVGGRGPGGRRFVATGNAFSPERIGEIAAEVVARADDARASAARAT